VVDKNAFEIYVARHFSEWLDGLCDLRARLRIEARMRRLQLGNPGDVKSVGDGVSEMRINYGPGYRIYFVQRGARIAVLLCGGDKRTQQRDIALAKSLKDDVELEQWRLN
jgi:putative addiction module killer protein